MEVIYSFAARIGDYRSESDPSISRKNEKKEKFIGK
jgi:hypothetical protein